MEVGFGFRVVFACALDADVGEADGQSANRPEDVGGVGGA